MKKIVSTVALLAVMASAALAQQITKDEIIKMSKEGVGEDVIVAKIKADKAAFALSTDDILELKKAGVGDKVLKAMVESKPADSKPQATLAKEANVIAKNSAHVPVYVTVDEKEKVFNVSLKNGAEMKVDGPVAGWKLADGDWTIAIEGRKTIDTFAVATGTPTNLTFGGANTSYVELVTLICESKSGRLVSIINSVGKLSEAEQRRSGFRRPGEYEGAVGPRYALLPFVSDRMLIGAGIGAIIGHQHGRTGEGALIGAAAGFTLDVLSNWRWRY